jgi:hypothetical protein
MAAPVTERRAWTTPADVVRLLRKRWQAGTFLTAFACSQGWDPFSVPVRGPAPREIAQHFGEVQAWAEQWERANRKLMRIEYRKVGGRVIGSNTIPCRAWIDSYDQLWVLLGVRRDVDRFIELLDATREVCPRLVLWPGFRSSQAS